MCDNRTCPTQCASHVVGDPSDLKLLDRQNDAAVLLAVQVLRLTSLPMGMISSPGQRKEEEERGRKMWSRVVWN